MLNLNETELQLSEVEGVQFFTDKDGNAGLSQNGLSRLCGVGENTLREYLKRSRQKPENTAVTVTDKQTGVRVSRVCIIDADTCVAAIEYYAFEAKFKKPNGADTARFTYRKFAKIGFTKWVQTITGFEPSNPSPVLAVQSELEMAKRYVALLEEKEQVVAYLGDKPGLAHKMSQANLEQKTLPGFFSFDELCNIRGFSALPPKAKRECSRKLANAVANDTLVQVGTKTVRIPGKIKPQYYKVKAYSVECLAAFDNVMSLYGQALTA